MTSALVGSVWFVLEVDDVGGTGSGLVEAELATVPNEVGSDAVVGTTELGA